MMPLVTAFYAALSALLILLLAFRVVRLRWRARVGVGDGGDRVLARGIRAHANAVEYLPLALLLLLLLELLAIAPVWLHVLGIVLILSRLFHAWGLSRSGGTSFGRLAGTLGTWLVILLMVGILLWQSIAWWLLTGA